MRHHFDLHRTNMSITRWVRRLLLAACTTASLAANANTLRIASAFDPQTMDPHALALLYHSRVTRLS